MPLITISRDSSGKLVFDPPVVTLDPAADFVSWANLDPDGEHQPTRQGKPKDYWLDDPLPRFVEGQPAATSPAVALTPLSPDVTWPPCEGVLGTVCISYVDGLDPDAASGTIKVAVVAANTQGGTQ
jgi:hypothetical protein